MRRFCSNSTLSRTPLTGRCHLGIYGSSCDAIHYYADHFSKPSSSRPKMMEVSVRFRIPQLRRSAVGRRTNILRDDSPARKLAPEPLRKLSSAASLRGFPPIPRTRHGPQYIPYGTTFNRCQLNGVHSMCTMTSPAVFGGNYGGSRFLFHGSACESLISAFIFLGF